MSGLGIIREGTEDREYLMQVFYISRESNLSRYEIHVVITWNMEAHLAVVKAEYERKDAVLSLDMSVEFFESDVITLDIPPDGITVQGWTITPLAHPVVSKRHVDTFRVGRRIPHCVLLAEVSARSRRKKLPSLWHQVTLKGSRTPHNIFTLILPMEDTSSRESSQTLGDFIADSATESAKPKLKDLLVELVSVASEWEDIGILLELETNQLRLIKSDNVRDKLCLRKMLKVWLSRVVPPPSWSEMATALDVLGYEDIATHLRTKYCSSSTLLKRSRLQGDESANSLSQAGGSISGQAHILTKEELQVLTGLLATDGEENRIRQSIQHGQAEGLTLEEVQRLLQDHGKIGVANELKDKLRKGPHLWMNDSALSMYGSVNDSEDQH